MRRGNIGKWKYFMSHLKNDEINDLLIKLTSHYHRMARGCEFKINDVPYMKTF